MPRCLAECQGYLPAVLDCCPCQAEPTHVCPCQPGPPCRAASLPSLSRSDAGQLCCLYQAGPTCSLLLTGCVQHHVAHKMAALRRDAPARQGRQGGNVVPDSERVHLLLCVQLLLNAQQCCPCQAAPMKAATTGGAVSHRCLPAGRPPALTDSFVCCAGSWWA